MSRLVSTRAGPEPIRRWRQQIARQQRRRTAVGPRASAAIGYLIRGPVSDGLVELGRLLFVTVHDEHEFDSHVVTRVAGFTAAAIPWGVKIGGPEQSRFEKDLGKAPTFRAKGRRFDVGHTPQGGVSLQGDGPEFEDLARRSENRNVDLLQANRRLIGGLAAFPLAFVSHAWRDFTSVYADLKSLPKRQVIALDHLAKNLCGFSGAIEFDLLHTRFSTLARSPAPPSRRPTRSFAG